MEEKLKLFNVGWDKIGDKPKPEFICNTQYHQIGNIRVFAYSAFEAYDYALIELSEQNKRTENNIIVTIPFIEEIKPELGVIREREIKWSDAKELGDWIKCYNETQNK
jgi:hypothetical protein